jgi:sigma-B regulation protein RsbU (phosphoserine phosphatase)
MMMAMIMIRNQALTGKSPEDVLMSVNDQICRNNREQLFVTVWLGILELSTGKLIASNAGHEKPIIKHADGDYELIMDKHGLVVGAIGGIKYRNYELRLYPGSKLFVYTDGLMEASDEKEEIFGSERALNVLNRAKDASPEELLEYVKSEVKRFEGGAPRFDDLTLLCLEYNGPAKREVEVSK